MAELTEMQMNVRLGSRAWAEVMLDTGRRTQGVGASATELELAGVGGVGYRCSAGRTGLYYLCGREVGD